MTHPIYPIVNRLLASGEKLVLARIIQRSGSAPRDVGAMCVVTKDRLFGSVGGGSIEYQMAQAARRLLDAAESSVYQFRMNNEDVAESGMICGGDVDLFLEPIFPGNKAKSALYENVVGRVENYAPGFLITRVGDRIPADREDANLFVTPDGAAIGHIEGVPSQYRDYQHLDANHKDPFALIAATGSAPSLFIERIDLIHSVVLFGAGHVSEYVSKLAKMVGFHVTVIDDRAEFANKERFPDADTVIVDGLETVFDQLHITMASYIVILTRGHLFDQSVLEKSLDTAAGYIGMIGSKRKRNLIYQSLVEKGIDQAVLDRVYSPIGVAINAQTPEEIAVSIVAELIQKRAPDKKTHMA
ncbi:MAG: XdhC family protein [Desulfobacteraceae bacterium]|jgi:xanthine dehydrogenase accessory factor